MAINHSYPIDKLDISGAQRLAAAVITNALADALRGDPAAIYWLWTADAAFWANVAGYDESKHLVNLARRCNPGRRKMKGRLTLAGYTRAISL